MRRDMQSCVSSGNMRRRNRQRSQRNLRRRLLLDRLRRLAMDDYNGIKLPNHDGSRWDHAGLWPRLSAAFPYKQDPNPGVTTDWPLFRCINNNTGYHFIEMDPNMCRSDQNHQIEGYYGYPFVISHPNLMQWSICYTSCGPISGILSGWSPAHLRRRDHQVQRASSKAEHVGCPFPVPYKRMLAKVPGSSPFHPPCRKCLYGCCDE